MATVGSACLAPHICLHTVRHWFRAVEKVPAISQLRRVLSSGSPVCVAGGCDSTTELAYGKHPSSLTHYDAIHDMVCADVTCGRALVFDLGSVADIRGSVFHPWLSF